MGKFRKMIQAVIPLRASVFEDSRIDIIQRIEEMNKRVTRIDNREKILYRSAHEKSGLESFRVFRERNDFQQCLIDLLKNLDEKSRATVIQVLKRQERVLDAEKLPLDIFSLEEQRRIKYIDEKVRKGVLKVSDNCFCLEDFMLPINKFELSIVYDRHGINMLGNKSELCNKEILDVGGYIGDSLPILSPLTSGRVYSFEPDPNNFALLNQTITMNDFSNVVPVQIALGDEDKTMELYSLGARSGFIMPRMEVAEVFRVPCVRLDTYLEDKSLDIGLIKVDIEGFERAFLAGAKKTIAKHRPILLISIYHNPKDFFFIKPLIESWDLGYSFKIHKPIDKTVMRDTVLIAEPV